MDTVPAPGEQVIDLGDLVVGDAGQGEPSWRHRFEPDGAYAASIVLDIVEVLREGNSLPSSFIAYAGILLAIWERGGTEDDTHFTPRSLGTVTGGRLPASGSA